MKIKKREEISFTDIRKMIDSIREYVNNNFSYVIPFEDFLSFPPRCGWFSPKTNTLFYIYVESLKLSKDKELVLNLDSPLKRKIASIYLSGCSSDKEYNTRIEKINKLKVFW